jgi:hypothetical protein
VRETWGRRRKEREEGTKKSGREERKEAKKQLGRKGESWKTEGIKGVFMR